MSALYPALPARMAYAASSRSNGRLKSPRLGAMTRMPSQRIATSRHSGSSSAGRAAGPHQRYASLALYRRSAKKPATVGTPPNIDRLADKKARHSLGENRPVAVLPAVDVPYRPLTRVR